LVDGFPIRRNTVLLAATLTCLSGMVQLAVAVATVTLVLVTGIEGILGLGPAIFLTAGALAALPAGRLMDRHGRIPVLAGGCVAGIVGCLVTALGTGLESAPIVVLGFALVGIAQGTILLARAAAADMYPPARRARGISYVLFGALFGAALGPLVFRPLLAGKELDTQALIVPWLAAGGSMVIGLVLVLMVRPTRRRSLASSTSTPAAATMRRPHRSARSSLDQASSPRSSLRSRALAAWFP
jgi:MFS family permease